MSERKVQFYMFGFEGGAGTRGASLGPLALKVADLDAGSRLFKRCPVLEIPLSFDYLYQKNPYRYVNRIDAVLEFSRNAFSLITENFNPEEHFPIFIGGDHSISIATVSAVAKCTGAHNLGVVWIDAHADLHSPLTTPSGNIHGMVLGALLGEAHRHLQVNTPSPEEMEMWQDLVNIGGFSPKLKWENIVYVGLRSTEPQENILIESHRVRVFTVKDLEIRGADRTATEILLYLSKCDKIHISLDVDVIDPLIARGTGTPVADGMRPHDIRDLLARFVMNTKVCSLDIVEINPTFDFENVMAEYVQEIIHSLVNTIEFG